MTLAGAAVQPATIRVGVETQTIGPWQAHADASLADAVRALGEPSSCKPVKGMAGFATVKWAGLGLRGTFGSYGVDGLHPCGARKVRLDNMRASGAAWRTGAGLRIGDSLSKLRRLYPHAFLRLYRRDIPAVRGWWLVVRTGVVPERYTFPALLATVRGGRVTSFVVSIQAQGD
ncbi:MAG TPA: hypothetical protein VF101_13375 [Gaiellaceae bacterium]